MKINISIDEKLVNALADTLDQVRIDNKLTMAEVFFAVTTALGKVAYIDGRMYERGKRIS